MNRHDVLLTIALVLTTLVWGSAFTAIKVLVEVLRPIDLAIVRFVVAAIGFVLLLIIMRVRHHPIGLSKRQTAAAVVLGFFGVVGYHVALNVGEERLTQTASADTAALLSGFLISTNSLFTILVVAMAGQERPSARRLAGVMVGLLGTAVLILWGRGEWVDRSSLTGALIVLLAPLSWAIYSVISKRAMRGLDPILITTWAMLAGTVLLLPLASTSIVADTRSLSATDWAWLLSLSLGATVGGYIVWGVALKHWDASRVSSFVYLVPLFGVVTATLVAHERMTAQIVGGGMLILAGLWLANSRARPRHATTAPI